MSLRFVGLQPRTLKSYKQALKNFFKYLEDENHDLPSKSHQLDELLATHLNHLWLDDTNVTYAGHTLSALRRFYPQLRYKLPVSRQFFSNWKSIHVPQQAVPMPSDVALAIAGVAVEVNDLVFALQVLLGFSAFLQISEITALKPSQIQVNEGNGQIILAVPATKTSRQKMESVAVTDELLASLTAQVLRTPASRSLGLSTSNQFRSKLASILDVLQLGNSHFSGYSLRRGGASHAFASGVHFDRLLVMGRWQSVKTARQYLDSGRAALIQLQFSAASLDRVSTFSLHVTSFCEHLRKKRA